MTKVKIPSLDSKRPNKLSLIFGGTIATIILLILIKVLISGHVDILPAKKNSKGHPVAHGPTNPKLKVDNTNSPLKPLADAGISNRVITKLYLRATGFNEAKHKKQLEQAKLVLEFKKKIHLDLKFPVTMDYIDLDLDNNVAGILGTSLDGKRSFAVLATNQKVTVEQAINYLKSSSDSFDFVNNHKFQPDKVIKFPAPDSTGLSPLTIIPATANKTTGQDLFAAMAERKDGKGTYVFMMAAPYSYFDRNEDGLEEMLKTVQAKP